MRRYFTTIILIILLYVFGCTRDNTKTLEPLLSTGSGSFVYQNDALNYGRPLTVLTYLPDSYTADSSILFVIHGNSRTADSYRAAWIDVAEEHNALLLVPHFAREAGFPESRHFNLGNMFEMDSTDTILAQNPENEWSYSLIDPIFDFVVAKMENKSAGYLIFGHSAGSQFLHRLMFFKPDAKIVKAVWANAGWYTMPDFDVLFPYGMKQTQCDEAALRRVFAKKVTVLLGDQDTDPDHRSLRRTPEAMEQGIHRFQRGHTFFDFCKNLAEEFNAPFAWDLQEVPGVAHSNAGMAPAAGEILF